MDEMSLASIPLCEKSKAPAAKTTMSVREMQHLLGLGKTESYWLIHKNFFEVIQINDKMRVVISSFEKWYANQIKYHKVNGPPPGEELRKRSYSVVEAAEILSVDTETIYTLIRRARLRQDVFGNFSKFIRLSARKPLVTSCLHISLNIFSIGFLAVSDCFTHTIKVVLPICTE